MTKTILMNLNVHEDLETSNEYYVEAKEGNRWKEVGGPYDTRQKAATFAQKYSIANHVPTRVVTTQ